MTRVVYLITDLDIGGAERSLFQLATRLPRDEFSIEVITLTGGGRVAKWLKEGGIPVTSLDIKRGWGLAAVFRLRRWLKNLRPDILHTFLFHANIMGRVAAAGLGVGAVISSVRVAERRFKWHLALDWLSSPLMNLEVCVSEGVRRFTETRAKIPKRKLTVIPNGVDLAEFEEKDLGAPIQATRTGRRPSDIRSSLHLSPDAPLILTIGRLDRQKGISFFLQAAREILQEFPQARFLIVGRGPDEGKLISLTRNLGIKKAVRFLGFRDDVPEVLAAADIFVLASLWEGMPNVVLEAMASGKPVVGTQVEGTEELVIPGETGFLVPPADAKALARDICRLMRESDLARRMGQAARKRIQEHYTVQTMVERYAQLYRDILESKSPPSNIGCPTARTGRLYRRV